MGNDADERKRLKERLAVLEGELAAVRSAVQSLDEEKPAAKDPAAPANVEVAKAASAKVEAAKAAPATGFSFAVMAAISVTLFVVLFALSRKIEPQEPPPQEALEPDEPLPTPPVFNIPAPGQPDAYGRQSGDPHYAHDHPVEEGEAPPPQTDEPPPE